MSQIAACKPDLLVVTAFGQILKKPLLELAPKGAVNIHASLLPQYRGAAPIHWAVMNGEATTGITTMYMAQGLDTGDMILQRAVEILPEDNTGILYEKLEKIGADLIVDTVDLIAQGLAPRQPQDHEKSSYAQRILREQEKIDWQKSAMEIHNQVRGLAPEIGAFAHYIEKEKQQVMKIWLTEAVDTAEAAKTASLALQDMLSIAEAKQPGVILGADKKGVFVRCGTGVIKLIEIQPSGKGKMKAIDWWRGKQNQLAEGEMILM